jgi:hypothetical protein
VVPDDLRSNAGSRGSWHMGKFYCRMRGGRKQPGNSADVCGSHHRA